MTTEKLIKILEKYRKSFMQFSKLAREDKEYKVAWIAEGLAALLLDLEEALKDE